MIKDKIYFEQLVKEVDTNGDGTIDYNEFLTMMTSGKIELILKK